MKKRLTGATFDASLKTVTHASFSDVTLAGIQLIVNVTDQIIIYNFADTTKGGTLSTDTLTLEYDTTTMSDTDELMILVEDGAASLAINDGGNTITVDGTVAVTGVATAANQLPDGHNVTIDNSTGAAAVNIQDGGNSITVDGTVAVTGVATAANQTTIIGHVDGIEGLLTTIDADTSNLSVVGGGTEAAAIRVTLANDSTGVLSVDDNGGSLTVDGTVAVTGVSTLAEQQTQTTSLAAIETAVEILDNAIAGTEMQVDVVGALPAGTNNIGDVDIASIAAGDNNIGNVDVVTLPALAAGTNYIGKTLPPDRDVTLHTAYAKKYYTSAGAATDGIIWSPAAGTRWHVVSMFINVSAAATVTLEDDKAGGDEAVLKMELAANSGTVINFGEHYPLASGEDAADLLITTSAGNVYVTVTGYEI